MTDLRVPPYRPVIADGPTDVPQLGSSLRIRNVPDGQCTYSCVYCCLGGTKRLRIRRRPFYATAQVVTATREQLSRCEVEAARPDYLAFMHGGEPTLDCHLGIEIDRLSDSGPPIVVMTNASLLWRPEVRSELFAAARVLVKIDTVSSRTWQRLNRPAAQLRLNRILSGIELFRAQYRGGFETESTLVPGLNDDVRELAALAAFLDSLAPAQAWLVIQRGSEGASAPSGMAALTAVRDGLQSVSTRLVGTAPPLETAKEEQR